MAFAVRIYLQGAGVFMVDHQGMTVLYPSDAAVASAKLKQIACPHRALVQLDGGQLAPAVASRWYTLPAVSQGPFAVDFQTAGSPNPFVVSGGGKIPDVAEMHDVLAVAGLACRLRSDLAGNEKELLRAKVRIEQGKVSSDSRFRRANWRFGHSGGGPSKGVSLTNCVLVELKKVDSFAVRITPFDGVATTYTLQPKAGASTVEVWVRHHCQVAEPQPNSAVILKEDEVDDDFILNYALVDGVAQLSQADREKLSLPTVGKGGLIGVDGGKCQCAQC